jgi:hypothetical protein
MKESMTNFFKGVIADVDGQISSKRLIVFLCTFALLITWASNLWWGAKLDEFIFEGLLYIVVVGLGVTAAEKFSRK